MFSLHSFSSRILFAPLSLLAFLLPTLAFAQTGAPAACAPGTYRLIAPVGGLTECLTLMQYLNGVFLIVIGIAGVLAVVMIVVCGIRMMMSGSVSGKAEAKGCITNALFGLLIAIGAWAILYTINPELLKNDQTLVALPENVTGTGGGPRAVAGYTFRWSPTSGCPAVPGSFATVVPPSNCPAGGTGTCCGYITVPSGTPTPMPPGILPTRPLLPVTSPPLPPPIPMEPPAPPAPPPPPPGGGGGGGDNPPTIIIAGGVPEIFTGNPVFTVAYSIVEDVRLIQVKLELTYLDHMISGSIVCSSAGGGGCPASGGMDRTATLDLGTRADGTYGVRITACDSGGKCSVESMAVVYKKGCASPADTVCGRGSTTFSAGSRVETVTSVAVRSAAGNTQPAVGTLSSGAQGLVLGTPVSVGGYWWWQVSFGAITGCLLESELKLAGT